MTPPGLAFVSVSAAAQAAALEQEPRSFYFDWRALLKAQAKLDAAFTPAVSLVRAQEVALGLELFSPDDDSSAVVTAVRMPDGSDSGELVRALRDRFGITIANGQGELKGRIFRIGHIGWFDIFDITTSLAALELVLADAGADIERGVAVTRALETYTERAHV